MTASIGILPLKSKADIILHPIKYKDSITYEPLAEEAVVALIAKHFTYDLVDEKTKEFFDDLDEGYLFSEANFDEFDLEKLEGIKEIIIGKDIYTHPKKDNILKLLTLLKLADIKVDVENIDNELDEIDELDSFDGSVVYFCDGDNDEIVVSKQFKIANKINKDTILVDNKEKKVIEDENLKGVFGIVYENCEDYPFKKVKIN